MSKFTPFEESLLVLTGLEKQLGAALRSLVPADRVGDDDLKWTVCNHIQILLCSFLEEWRIFESFGKDSSVRDTLKIVSPALGRIRRWTGLARIRSTLLAHNQRDKEGNPVWTWDVFNSNEAPTAYAETLLLGNLALFVVRETRRRHHDVYHRAAQRLTQSYAPIKEQGIRTIGEMETVLQRLKVQMSEIAEGFRLKR